MHGSQAAGRIPYPVSSRSRRRRSKRRLDPWFTTLRCAPRIESRPAPAWRLRGGSGRPRIRWRPHARSFSRAVCWSRGIRRFTARCKRRPAVRRQHSRRTTCRRLVAGWSFSAVSMGVIRASPGRSKRGCLRPSTARRAMASTRRMWTERSHRSSVSCANATTHAIHFRSSFSPGFSPPPCTVGSQPPCSTYRLHSRRYATRRARARTPRSSSGGVCATIRKGSP